MHFIQCWEPDFLNVLDCMDTMFGEYKFVIEISSGRIQNCRPGRLREMSLRCKLNARNGNEGQVGGCGGGTLHRRPVEHYLA